MRTAPEKPRCILIALQEGKSDKQEKNASVFDHVKMTQMSVKLNAKKYPARYITADFTQKKVVEYSQTFSNFSRDYYGLDPLTSGTSIDLLTYKKRFPIFYFDVSKQSEIVNRSVVDVTVRMKFDGNLPENVVAHALIISIISSEIV